MKKVLITLTMVLALGTGVQTLAQKHRHTPQVELTDSTSKDATAAAPEATSTDSSVSARKGKVTISTPMGSQSWEYDEDDYDTESVAHHIFGNMRAKDIGGMMFILCVLLIVFILAPVLIIVTVFYFINKNRKEKMRLAQMAMQQGQPIPDELLKDKQDEWDKNDYQSGMRQCFVGVGLMIFLGYAAGQVGFGIGALVFCIGLGKVFASRTGRTHNQDRNNFNSSSESDHNQN